MNRYCFLLFFFFFLSCDTLFAQKPVAGRIFSSATDSVIASATVVNKSRQDSKLSRKDGRYSINAEEGDTLVFSAMGYHTDTVVVEFYMQLTPMDISLDLKMVTLDAVRLLSSYKTDSINRRNYYAHILDKKNNITGGNRPTDGVGISISPLSYFSKQSKQKRQLKKRLEKQEQEDYIDRSFPAGWVARLTGLSGDSLNLFMYRYRPSYDYCRMADRTEMTVYVSEKIREFRKPK